LNILLDHTNTKSIKGKIVIPGSKSESNRLLILQQIFSTIKIENLSTSDDTSLLKEALQNKSDHIDIGHAGTAMRFLTAFFACTEYKTITLTGSARMQERPIKVLVDALLTIGADITYLKNVGYPPLLIKGKKLSGGEISMKGNISSQYISALLLIAPTLPNGLTLQLEGEITSLPYIQMTLSLLTKIGIKATFKNNKIVVKPIQHSTFNIQHLKIEPDWTSASYFYSVAALFPNTHIELLGLIKNSLQGDNVLADIYQQLGVQTTYTPKGIVITSKKVQTQLIASQQIILSLENTPDLAQTIAVTCLGLGINCQLSGLDTLKIKETDRLLALKIELEKFGASVIITDNSLQLIAPKNFSKNLTNHVPTYIKTYDDHRMAMSFAPLSLKVPLQIENPDVVSKSYPAFWKDFKLIMDNK